MIGLPNSTELRKYGPNRMTVDRVTDYDFFLRKVALAVGLAYQEFYLLFLNSVLPSTIKKIRNSDFGLYFGIGILGKIKNGADFHFS